jgi:hypothetical protein
MPNDQEVQQKLLILAGRVRGRAPTLLERSGLQRESSQLKGTPNMEKHQLARLVQEILNEARPGQEHERLKRELTTWAGARGYMKVYPQFQDGCTPDVLRTNVSRRFLFVGDAKDATNETADNANTLERISGYFKNFHDLLGPELYSGGELAIATNDAQEATRWVGALNVLARQARIVAGDDSKPNFAVEPLPEHSTWIIHW